MVPVIKKNGKSKKGAARRAFSCFTALPALIIALAFASTSFSQSMTEFGSEDDLTVLGTDGTVPDPDVEVKGFSVFGSTNVLTHISTAPGNVIINGALEVSSDVYVVGQSTFSGRIYLAPPIGERALLGLYSEAANSTLHSRIASNSYDDSLLIAGVRSRGTLEIPSSVLNKDVFLRLAGRGYGSTAAPVYARTWIDFIAAEDWTDTKQGSAMVFNTTLTGGVSQGERLRIDGNGNIGISTGAPQARLDVLAGGSTPGDMAQIWRAGGGAIVSSMSATGVMMATKFVGDGSGLTGVTGATDDTKVLKTGDTMTGQLTISGSSLTVLAPDTLASSLWVSTSVTTPHLYVSTNGNVGIGTVSPAALLDISNTSSGAPLLSVIGRMPTGGLLSRAIILKPTISGPNTNNGLGGFSIYSNVEPAGVVPVAYGNVLIGALADGSGASVGQYFANYVRYDSSANFTGAINNASALEIGPTTSLFGNKPINIYGLKLGKQGSSGITNAYGAYISNQGVAGVTNSYGLYMQPQTGAINSYAAIFAGGDVGISTGAPQARLDVLAGGSTPGDMAQIWRDGGGAIISSVSATGVMMAAKFVGDGSGITGITGVTDDTKVLKAGDTMTGQLTVIAPDTLTSSLWVSTSATTPHLYVSRNGNIGIGTSTPAALLDISGGSGNRSLLNIRGQYDLPVGGARAIVFFPKVSGSANGIGAIQATSFVMPTGNFSTAFGNVFTGMLDEGGGTTVTNFYSNYMRSDSSASYTGAISNMVALNIGNSVYKYGNKPTNSYGLMVENQGAAGITNSYGLYVNPQTGATNSYAAIFAGGDVGISTGAPQARLDVLAGGSTPGDMAQIWRDSAGTIVSSISATGVFTSSSIIAGLASIARVPVQAEDAGVTVAYSDFGKTITVNSASAQTVTLPSVTAADIGATLTVVKLGAGKVTIQAAVSTYIGSSTSGGTIYNTAVSPAYAAVTIRLVTATQWMLIGGDGAWISN